MNNRIGSLETIGDDADLTFIAKTSEPPRNYNEQTITESNIIKDVIDNLDRDVVDPKTQLTSIDFNTRITETELGPIVALQMLASLGVGGPACSLLARSVKRHKVSLNGQGRAEKVLIIQGEREHSENKDNSLFGKVRGIFGGKNNEQG